MGQGSSTSKITAQDKAIFQMKQQRDKLKQYQRRINGIIERQTNSARDALKQGDKDKAKFYLKSKKHQQSIISRTYDQLENLENLLGTIEFKLIEKDVLYGLNEGNKVLTKLNNEMSTEKIDKILDALEDEKLRVDEVSDLLGAGNLNNREELEVDEEFEKLNREINGVEVQFPEVASGPIEQSINLPKIPNTDIENTDDTKEETSHQAIAV